jgi:hypothetical protein
MRLLPTIHVSKFDPAMSWEKPYRAWPSRQPDSSNAVNSIRFLAKLTQEQYQNGAGNWPRAFVAGSVPIAHEPVIPLIA